MRQEKRKVKVKTTVSKSFKTRFSAKSPGANGLRSKKHILELSLSLDLLLVHSGNHLHCINLNVPGERWRGAKRCLFEQKTMIALTLESTPIELWSKSFTTTPFLTRPLEKH